MADNTLGLYFEIDADPSKAEAAMEQFKGIVGQAQDKVTGSASKLGEAADEAAKRFTDAGNETDKALLNSHQSVHLLAEEMGIHLPRAVLGAISEMLPNINMLGGALLGVFAVKEIVEWGKAGVEAIHEMRGETKELAQEMAEIVREQEHILRHPESLAAAQKDLEETTRRLGDIAKRVNELQTELQKAPTAAENALALTAGQTLQTIKRPVEEISEELNKLQGEQERLEARQKEQLDAKTKLEQEAQKEAARAAKESNRTQEEAANKEIQNIHRVMEAEKQLHEWHYKAMAEAAKQIGMDEKGNAAAAEQAEFLAKQQLLDLTQKLHAASLMTYGDLRMAVPQMVLATNATVHLTQASTLYIGVLQRIHQEAQHAKQALGDMAAATVQAGVAAAISGQNIGKAMEQSLKATLSSIASEAAVRALYNVGLGIYYEAIQDYPDADLAFSAAEVFGAIGVASGVAAAAIPGGGGGGGRGSTAGGNQSSYGGSPGSGGPGSGGGSGSRGPNIVMNMYGPLAGSYQDLAKALTPVFNQLGSSGQLRLTAYNALTNGAKQT